MKKERETAIRFLEQYHRLTDRVKLISEQMFETERVLQAMQACVSEKEAEPDWRRWIAAGERQQRELSLRRTALIARRNMIGEVVARLPMPERRVIERYFLEGTARRAADELMEELEFEKTHIYRLREKGLERVADLMKGPEPVFGFLPEEEITVWDLPAAERKAAAAPTGK